MRTFFSRLYRRVLVRSLSWLLSKFGLVAVRSESYYAARVSAIEAIAFCERSGFLRDERYPGGRHAERKLRHLLVPAILLHRWQDDG